MGSGVEVGGQRGQVGVAPGGERVAGPRIKLVLGQLALHERGLEEVDHLLAVCGPAQAQPIAAAITGSQLVMLAGCGHIPSIETPQQYRHAVAEFLRG